MEEPLVRIHRQQRIRELAAQITELAGHLNAANHRWLQLIAEFDRCDGWSDGLTHSCAHWLNWQCGLDLGAARERVRVAHALEKLPQISVAMAQGRLSFSKVRALTRVATAPTESYFLSIALHGTAHHVEKLVRAYRRAQEAQELSREAQQQATRALHYYHDEDGSLVFKGRLPAECGALFLKAIEAAGEEAIEAHRVAQRDARLSADGTDRDVSAATPELPPSHAARRADALTRLAESFLKHGPQALNGGERHQVVLHVDVDTLRSGVEGRCELEDGPALAVETARRLACDASVVTLIENADGEPMNVGRKTRSVSPALHRALKARDQGCRFPGCTHQRYVDAHHIHHWAHGGETKASNLVSLCRFHHRKVHEGGVRIEVLDDGALRFNRPDGQAFDSIVPGHTRMLTDWHELVDQHRNQGPDIDPNTATTRWRGERMDYGLALDVLLQQARGAVDVSSETTGD